MKHTASAGSLFSEYAWGYTERAENLHIAHERGKPEDARGNWYSQTRLLVRRLCPSTAAPHSSTFTRTLNQRR